MWPNPQFPVDFVTFTEETLNWIFVCVCVVAVHPVPFQRPKIELFVEVTSGWSLFTFFPKILILDVLPYRNEVIHFIYFSGTFPTSEYPFSAPRGLFILVVLSRFRVIAQRLKDSCRTLRWRLAVLFRLPSIFSVLLEDSWKILRWRFFNGTIAASEYLRS